MASMVAASQPAAAQPAASQQWLVVETYYNTTYGCYRGRRWTRADHLRDDAVTRHGPFATYDVALEAAHELRRMNDSYVDCDEFFEGREPPWDSAQLENWDNDNEVRFELRTVAAQGKKDADDREFMAVAEARETFNSVLSAWSLKKLVTMAGRVHYSRPPKPYDIKADLEADEVSAAAVSDAAAAAATTLRFQPTGVKGSSAAVVRALAGLAARCPHLRELHYFVQGHTDFTEECIKELAARAPHLANTLVFLRVTGNISPDALGACAYLRALERLDISDCFTTEYGSFDYESDDSAEEYGNSDKNHPYNAGLRKVAALPNLTQIDLGYGDDDMTRYLWDYCLSPRCADQVQEEHGVALTMAEMKSSPLPWAPGGALDELLQETIREIAEQHEDPGIRGLAQLALDGAEMESDELLEMMSDSEDESW